METMSANGRAVYQDIHQQIVDGKIRPGTRLVEATLASAFGMSRTPIREALNRLAQEGLLERHDRAMRVRVLSIEDVAQIYEVRIALERAAGRAAAERRTDLELRGLTQIVDRMQDLPSERADERSTLAHAFHFALWNATRNPVLIETLRTIHVRVIGLSMTTLHIPERWETFRVECATILAAVASRDVDEAGRLAELQMINSRDVRLDVYTANGGRIPDMTVAVPMPADA